MADMASLTRSPTAAADLDQANRRRSVQVNRKSRGLDRPPMSGEVRGLWQ